MMGNIIRMMSPSRGICNSTYASARFTYACPLLLRLHCVCASASHALRPSATLAPPFSIENLLCRTILQNKYLNTTRVIHQPTCHLKRT